MESDIGHASDCVFYDSELKNLSKNIKECYKQIRDIEKRAERRQTIQISDSLFTYVEKQRERKRIPTEFYRFLDDDVVVEIYRYRGFYRVLVLGFDWPRTELPFYAEWIGKGTLYGEFDTLDSCIPYYYRAVMYYITQIRNFGDLFSDVVPF